MLETKQSYGTLKDGADSSNFFLKGQGVQSQNFWKYVPSRIDGPSRC